MPTLEPSHYATFKSLRQGPLNPGGMRVPCVVDVEVYQLGPGRWRVRERSLKKTFSEITARVNPFALRYEIAQQFDEMLQPWAIAGTRELPELDKWLHIEAVPSLCGHRPPILKDESFITESLFRTERLNHERRDEICRVCISGLDRRPHVNDLVKADFPQPGRGKGWVTVYGTVMSLPNLNHCRVLWTHKQGNESHTEERIHPNKTVSLANL